jgi:hypothetical protein
MKIFWTSHSTFNHIQPLFTKAMWNFASSNMVIDELITHGEYFEW